MFQVALHRVAAARGRVLAFLGGVAESQVQLCLAAIGQVRDAPGDGQAGVGTAAGAVVVAALPVRVGLDGRDLGALRADLVGGGPGADGQQQPRTHPIRVADHPFQRAGTTHRAAQYGRHLGDAQRGQRGDVGLHLVANRDCGKPGAPRFPVTGQRSRAGRPATAAQHVGRHRTPAVGVDRSAGPDHPVPPAWGGMTRPSGPGDVRIPGQGVQHHDDVVALGRQLAPALHRDVDVVQYRAALQRQ